jgi:hypothetical protein
MSTHVMEVPSLKLKQVHHNFGYITYVTVS